MALRLAHRGDHATRRSAGRLVENSIAALVAAAGQPDCDGVEFDVRLSADGVPVVHHDETLQRVHGVPIVVADSPASRLEEVGVSTLEELLAALPRRSFLDVEIKVPIGRDGVAVLAAARGPELRRGVVSSFVPEALRQIRGLAPTWPLWLNSRDLAPGTIDLAVDLGCVAISAEWRAIDRRSIARARAAGLDVAAWTVTRLPTYRRLARLGVVAICAEGAALSDAMAGEGNRSPLGGDSAADGKVA